jgi:tetratricopeptide (TPR) repeat protein
MMDGGGDDDGRAAGSRVSRGRVVSGDLTDRDVQQEAGAERDTNPAASGLTMTHETTSGAEEAEACAPQQQDSTRDQMVVGCIPGEPAGFQPRTELVAQLDRGGAGVSVLHAAEGKRGVGTTALAATYARAKLAAGWPLVAWVNAETAGNLRAGLAAVADAVGLSETGSGREAVDPGGAVRHRLEADGDRWLLVFDGANDAEMLRPFIPVGGAAQVLITGAGPSVASLGAEVPVDAFTTDEALAFLTDLTGLEDAEGAGAVAQELGCLPLALAQAAAVIAGPHPGYGSYPLYLERLRAVPIEEHLVPGEEQPYPHGVLEAVLLSLDVLQSADQVGVWTGLTEIMAVLSPARINRDLLSAAGRAGLLSSGRRLAADHVDQALEQMARWSLLTFSQDGQTILVHSLIARLVRDGLARRDRLTSVCRAVASLLEARANELAERQDRQAARDIAGQATALVENAAGPAGEIHEELRRALLPLRFLTLYHLIELGDSAPQAIAVGEPLIADLEQVLGSSHPDTLNSRNSLAAAYRAAGRAAEAVPLFERTLVSRQRVLGPGHPDTLTSQNNLAAAYQDAGRVAEAILMSELTLAAREYVMGEDHPSTLNSRGNLAVAYRDAGRAEEAILLFEQTLAGRERVLGGDHSDTLNSRNHLANAYRDADRIVDALPLIAQTLAARERTLGPDHPRTLGARNNLAVAYRDAGRAEDAIPLHEQTLAACERLLGTDHHKTMSSRKSLAAAYRDAGRAAEAIVLIEQLLAAQERVLGADHPDTVTTRDNLALAYEEAGRAE